MMKLFILSLAHFLHLTAAVIWIGGIAMILFAILPSAKAVLEPALVSKFMKEVTKRFTPMANLSILVLFITGTMIGFNNKSVTNISSHFWNIFAVLKLFLAIAMVILHFYRGLILNSIIEKASFESGMQGTNPLTTQVPKLQRVSLNLIKTNFILGLLVLLITGILLSA